MMNKKGVSSVLITVLISLLVVAGGTVTVLEVTDKINIISNEIDIFDGSSEISKDSVSQEYCTIQKFGEYQSFKLLESNPDAYSTPSSSIHHYFRSFCKNHGGVDLKPYEGLNPPNVCSEFYCVCESGDYLKDVMSEDNYCDDINVRKGKKCNEQQFREDNYKSTYRSMTTRLELTGVMSTFPGKTAEESALATTESVINRFKEGCLELGQEVVYLVNQDTKQCTVLDCEPMVDGN